MEIGLELRSANDSDFILHYDSSAGIKYVMLVEDFYLSILRLKPTEKLRPHLHKLLSSSVTFPVINRRLIEHILIRGSSVYEISDLFTNESNCPIHFFCFLQEENVLTSELVKAETNPFKFTTCNLDSFVFRSGDIKYPASLYSSSGIFYSEVLLDHTPLLEYKIVLLLRYSCYYPCS